MVVLLLFQGHDSTLKLKPQNLYSLQELSWERHVLQKCLE